MTRSRFSFLFRAASQPLVALALLGALTWWSCSKPNDPGALRGNTPPLARLANVFPSDSVTQNVFSTPRVTLHWVGDDPDGYVTAFRFRWSYVNSGATIWREWRTVLNITFPGQIVPEIRTGSIANIPKIYQYLTTLTQAQQDSVTSALVARRTLVVFGDSVSRADSATIHSPNKGTFIFESPDTLNRHVFQVKAVDNEGAESVQPAQSGFFTPKASEPNTRLISPLPKDSSYVLNHLTDTFRGIRFLFEGVDAQSRHFEYSWSVDSVSWTPYSRSNEAVVTARDMALPITGNHFFYVKAKNEFGIEDPTPLRYRFYTIFPQFADSTAATRILVINNTPDSSAVGVPRSATLNAFYQRILDSLGWSDKYDVWNVRTQQWPSRSHFGRYRVVLFYAEYPDMFVSMKVTELKILILRDYLNAGGKMIFSGWELPTVITGSERIPFYIDMIHAMPDTFPRIHDFVGAYGNTNLGYTSLQLDTTKLAPAWNSMLRRMPTSRPLGFAEVIYLYQSRSLNPMLHGQPVGVRFIGPPGTFRIVYFGLPLFYTPYLSAYGAIRKALTDLGEN